MYSAGRIKALETTLLSDTSVERMLGAKSMEEFFKVLQDTFLSEYIPDPQKTTLSRALRKCMTRTKEFLAEIAPEPELLDVLWIRYDFYNLKTIYKGIRAGLDDEAILERCYKMGKYDIEKLLEWVRSEDLSLLPQEMQEAYRAAEESKQVYEIDRAMNLGYFTMLNRIRKELGNAFIDEYVTLVVDFFNIRTRLRIINLDGLGIADVGDFFVFGGSISRSSLETKENIFQALSRFGEEVYWKESWEEYLKKGHYTMLEREMDNYLVKYIKEKSVHVFSVETLFAFFVARKNNTELVKTIAIGKKSGVSEGELRKMLRRLYT
jgi:vacuolar-type H+-ATPase subunit C/Vma6